MSTVGGLEHLFCFVSACSVEAQGDSSCLYLAVCLLPDKVPCEAGAERCCCWLPGRRGRKIAMDVARGMDKMHSRHIIHLDLKSPNILLTASGTAKIAVRLCLAAC